MALRAGRGPASYQSERLGPNDIGLHRVVLCDMNGVPAGVATIPTPIVVSGTGAAGGVINIPNGSGSWALQVVASAGIVTWSVQLLAGIDPAAANESVILTHSTATGSGTTIADLGPSYPNFNLNVATFTGVGTLTISLFLK